VQGVGFRPTVCRFAAELDLTGFVRNDAEGVLIEVEGHPESLDRFVDRLTRSAPAVARIDSVETAALPARGERAFRIAPSARTEARDPAPVTIPPDLAPCAECLRELRDPADRRHRYPFINCTSCGPRFTIVRSSPYDRVRTTMDAFPLCTACLSEFTDPANRRFHAQATACPACGPTLSFVKADRCVATGEGAVSAAAAALREGLVVAIKGVGGFLLAVDARNPSAVQRLRERKRRPDKPFAVMGRSLEGLQRVAALDEAARVALESSARPIVLAPVRTDADLAPEVAPGLAELGVALPPTPLQHLLLLDGPELLVMTSGNVSDEPIARTNAEALERLEGVADAFVVHDREVHARADDSVVRVLAGEARLVRRARGYVPEAFPLPFEPPREAVLAVGAELKTTLCLAADGSALLSQHVGDLSSVEARAFFEETAAALGTAAGVQPRAFAHDLHPDYPSSRWARRRAEAVGVRAVAVAHHHAHVASGLVEHGRAGPVLGVVFDGTGLGPDGALWGGEFLLADLVGFRRLGHLAPIALPGGETAIRSPWRLAVAALVDAGEPLDVPALRAIGPSRLDAIARAVPRPRLSPASTGAGRWFDAVAALAGVRSTCSYDGQAPMELEAVAAARDQGAYDVAVAAPPAGPFVVELRAAVRALARDLRGGTSAAVVSARFHATLARGIVAACVRARNQGAPGTVLLTGGCFQNRLLTEAARAGLEREGFEVLLHRRVPCNDGGLALGQAAVAAFRLSLKEAAPCA
jgi:hydrogenase maturation protein HypF